MLSVHEIDSFYGTTQALFGMSIEVNEGEIITLLGRNGMGKTTTIRSIMGLIKPRAGSIWFQDQDITDWPAFRIANAGLGLAPEGRHIFPNLTVMENLIATSTNKNQFTDPWDRRKSVCVVSWLGIAHQNKGQSNIWRRTADAVDWESIDDEPQTVTAG